MKNQHLTRLLITLMIVTLLSGCNLPQPQASQPPPAQVEVTPLPIPTDPAQPTAETPIEEPPAAAPTWLAWVAYNGHDGNVYLAASPESPPVQITFDAATFPLSGENTPLVQYQMPKWSSDGLFVAFERQEGRPVPEGYLFTFSLWVYNVLTEQAYPVLQNASLAGYDWKPGSHILAFGEQVDPNYFSRTGVDPSLARGLSVIDVDSGLISQLVQPARGFHLAGPRWSPDGRFISFQEVYLMEGTGKFAVYNLATGQYLPWDQSIGAYAWGPDGETIIFDDMTYIAQGNEAVYTRRYDGGEVARLTPPIENGYFYGPVISRENGTLAFLGDMDGLDGTTVTVYVAPAPGAAPQPVGSFEHGNFLSWAAGGTHLVLVTGPWDSSQVVLLAVADGAVTILGQGSQPAWNPLAKLQ